MAKYSGYLCLPFIFWLSNIICLLRAVSSPAAFPFRNTSLSWEERLDDLVSRLEVPDIVLQLTRGGAGPNGPAPAIARLGIGPCNWNTECIHGDGEAGNATSFPQALGLAATFDVNVIYEVAKATSEEVRAKYNNLTQHGIYSDHGGLSCFSPVVNIMRHPLWGRNQETYGEDPFLTGVAAKAFINGLRGTDERILRTSAGCKHFDVHSGPEDIPSSRFTFNAMVTDEDLYMTYLPAFRECVKAGSYGIMCSYNSINGVPSCVNKRFLTDILRTEFGFQGYVVSDQKAVEYVLTKHKYTQTALETAVAAVKAGCNLELCYSAHNVYTNLTKALQLGLVAETELRALVRPLFYTRLRLGEFDPPAMNPYAGFDAKDIVESEPHRNVAITAAIKSFVLLKNEGGVLPVGKIHTLAVVGPFADSPQEIMGSYKPMTDPKFITTPRTGLKNLAQVNQYAAGCNDPICDTYNHLDIMNAVAGADLIVVCLGTGVSVESEGNDRRSMSLPGHQLQLLQDAVKYASGKPVVLLLFNAGPLDIRWADANPGVPVIIECFFPGQATGVALRALLSNDGSTTLASPAGRLPFTWPTRMDQVPPMTDYSMANRTYRYSSESPLYPFGYGLSYTQFKYIDLTLTPETIGPCDDVSVNVTLMNIGKYDADETIEVYIQWHNSSVIVPKLQLAAFARRKTTVKNQITIELTIPVRVRAVYKDSLVLEPGLFTVYAGGQQPGQKRQVGSNVLSTSFKVEGPVTSLSKCTS
ncbi:uncharacterized protein [Asterias amurensis]|uniref:uncharacterized protein n=1 Tax=Asterias amurensis TaxID=7602 RepID=UPI003AB1563D